jgi:hypothetical protein
MNSRAKNSKARQSKGKTMNSKARPARQSKAMPGGARQAKQSKGGGREAFQGGAAAKRSHPNLNLRVKPLALTLTFAYKSLIRIMAVARRSSETPFQRFSYDTLSPVTHGGADVWLAVAV